MQVFQFHYRNNLRIRKLFGKWRKDWLAKGNAHGMNKGFDHLYCGTACALRAVLALN